MKRIKMMNITVDFTTRKKEYGVSRTWIVKRIEKMVDHFSPREKIPTIGKFEKHVQYLLSVALVGDRAIRTINRDYRKQDKVTDVISVESDPSDFFSGSGQRDLERQW